MADDNEVEVKVVTEVDEQSIANTTKSFESLAKELNESGDKKLNEGLDALEKTLAKVGASADEAGGSFEEMRVNILNGAAQGLVACTGLEKGVGKIAPAVVPAIGAFKRLLALTMGFVGTPIGAFLTVAGAAFGAWQKHMADVNAEIQRLTEAIKNMETQKVEEMSAKFKKVAESIEAAQKQASRFYDLYSKVLRDGGQKLDIEASIRIANIDAESVEDFRRQRDEIIRRAGRQKALDSNQADIDQAWMNKNGAIAQAAAIEKQIEETEKLVSSSRAKLRQLEQSDFGTEEARDELRKLIESKTNEIKKLSENLERAKVAVVEAEHNLAQKQADRRAMTAQFESEDIAAAKLDELQRKEKEWADKKKEVTALIKEEKREQKALNKVIEKRNELVKRNDEKKNLEAELANINKQKDALREKLALAQRIVAMAKANDPQNNGIGMAGNFGRLAGKKNPFGKDGENDPLNMTAKEREKVARRLKQKIGDGILDEKTGDILSKRGAWRGRLSDKDLAQYQRLHELHNAEKFAGGVGQAQIEKLEADARAKLDTFEKDLAAANAAIDAAKADLTASQNAIKDAINKTPDAIKDMTDALVENLRAQ